MNCDHLRSVANQYRGSHAVNAYQVAPGYPSFAEILSSKDRLHRLAAVHLS